MTAADGWRASCAATLRRCRELCRQMSRGEAAHDRREWLLQAEALEQRSAALARALDEAAGCEGGLPLELESRLWRAEHAARVSERQVRRLWGERPATPGTEKRKENRDTTRYRH